MPTLDVCHDQVLRAFQKDGWQVVQSPSRVYVEPRYVYIDARLSRGTNGRREQVMLLEIKCFPDEDSTTRDFYTAIGQYLLYRAMIRELGWEYPLYLSVPASIFELVFDTSAMRVVRESQIKIVVVDIETETITQWIES